VKVIRHEGKLSWMKAVMVEGRRRMKVVLCESRRRKVMVVKEGRRKEGVMPVKLISGIKSPKEEEKSQSLEVSSN
jgi:hypothetical protein